MKFKFAQTRVVRYAVVIEAESYEDAYDQVFNHEEWQEDGIESDDPPWQEDCPEDADPDVHVLHGYVIPAGEYLKPANGVMLGCDGSPIRVGSRVMVQRGEWNGAPWFPATVTYLYKACSDRGLDALVQEDAPSRKPEWVTRNRIRAMQPHDEAEAEAEIEDDEMLDDKIEDVVLPLSDEAVLALDAGIRDLVIALRAKGFETTDSGDGESKPFDERELEYPHVFMVVPADCIVEEARRLQAWVDADEKLSSWTVEASYSPKDGVALLYLCSTSFLPTEAPEADPLEELRERAEKAEANYAFMVERAANQHLDGYRELGARAASAENEADRLRARLRETARILIAEVGADGPMDAEEAARKAVERMVNLRTLADEKAHEAGLYARRMEQAQRSRDTERGAAVKYLRYQAEVFLEEETTLLRAADGIESAAHLDRREEEP